MVHSLLYWVFKFNDNRLIVQSKSAVFFGVFERSFPGQFVPLPQSAFQHFEPTGIFGSVSPGVESSIRDERFNGNFPKRYCALPINGIRGLDYTIWGGPDLVFHVALQYHSNESIMESIIKINQPIHDPVAAAQRLT